MKNNVIIQWLACLGMALMLMSCGEPRLEAGADNQPDADVVLLHAQIYTVDDAQPWAQAIAIKDNKIVFVGSNKNARSFVGPATRLIDATGKMILPGLIDSHVHPIWGGGLSVKVNLRQAKTVAEVQAIIRRYRQQNPNLKYLSGGSWVAQNFPKSGPKKEWLDEVAADIPVLLYDHFGHTAWANSLALEMAGLNKDTKNPPGGMLERDIRTGELTGTLREEPAFKMIRHIVPSSSPELRYKSMRSALNYMNSQGITSFITAYMVGEPLGQVFSELYENGDLTARTLLSFKVRPGDDPDLLVPLLLQRRAELEGIDRNFITANMAKIFLDGVIRSHTAAMLEPYVGEYRKFNSEAYLYSDEKLRAMALKLDNADFQLHFHTVGDGAARQALDVMETLNQRNGDKDRRATVSHLLSIADSDFKRFKSLGVYPNAQLYWSKHNENIGAVERHFGAARSKLLYAYGRLHSEGATLVGGSDWPVSTASPFAAMQMAATRPYTSLNANAEEAYQNQGAAAGWLPEQKISDIESLLRAFTINGARLQFREGSIGSLEVGKLADLVVIDRNILERPVEELHLARVLMTMVDGKFVYEDSSL